MVCRGRGRRGVREKGGGEMGKDFCLNFLQPFLEKIERRSLNNGSPKLYSTISQPSPKMPALSFGGDSHL